MTNQATFRLPRFVILIASMLFLAGCTKFHVSNASPTEASTGITDEMIEEFIVEHLVADVHVSFETAGVRFSWTEEDDIGSGQYWIFASTDGRGYEPVYTFQTGDEAGTRASSVDMNHFVPYGTPELDAERLSNLIQQLKNGQGELVLNPATGVPFDIELIIKQLLQGHEEGQELLRALEENPDGWRTIYAQAAALVRKRELVPEGVLEQIKQVNWLLVNAVSQEENFDIIKRLHEKYHDVSEDYYPGKTPDQRRRYDPLLPLGEKQEFFIVEAFSAANGNKLSHHIHTVRSDEMLEVVASSLGPMTSSTAFKPQLLGSPVLYAPGTADTMTPTFYLSTLGPGYTVVADPSVTPGASAFVLCRPDASLVSNVTLDNPWIHSCHGGTEERHLRVESFSNRTSQLKLAFFHEPALGFDLEQKFEARFSIILPEEIATVIPPDESTSTSSITVPVAAAGIFEEFHIQLTPRQKVLPLIVSIEIFEAGNTYPVYWDVYEIDTPGLFAQ